MIRNFSPFSYIAESPAQRRGFFLPVSSADRILKYADRQLQNAKSLAKNYYGRYGEAPKPVDGKPHTKKILRVSMLNRLHLQSPYRPKFPLRPATADYLRIMILERKNIKPNLVNL